MHAHFTFRDTLDIQILILGSYCYHYIILNSEGIRKRIVFSGKNLQQNHRNFHYYTVQTFAAVRRYDIELV